MGEARADFGLKAGDGDARIARSARAASMRAAARQAVDRLQRIARASPATTIGRA